MEIAQIQNQIASTGADAWVLIDYENRNPNVVLLLGQKMLTRKIIMVIPSCGKPYLITHFIDTVYLSDEVTKKNFDLLVYHTWQEMLKLEEAYIGSYNKVLMDISDNGLLMRASLADYGSVEFVKSLGVEVESSADLQQMNSALISDRGYQLQLQACKLALQIKDEAFAKIKHEIEANGQTDELTIQTFIADRFHEEGMVYDDPPLVAIGPNASNPHYTPTPEAFSQIKEGDLVLIDMWAKMDDPEGVYADITWMGFVGEEVPDIYKERFDIVKAARDNTIAFLKREVPVRKVHGYEADDVARETITKAGYGEYFLHRVGHNIAADISPHGPGANLDDYETHDERYLLENTSFSVEPGIYAPDFGIRSETNVHIRNNQPIVVAGLQEEIIPIMGLKI